MRTRIPKPADREEWLTARRPYFNASAAAVLYDRHPFMSPGDYAVTKLTGQEQEQTSAMRRGVMLEDAIAQWWAMDHACSVREPEELYVAGRIMATVDRWAGDDDCPVEIKTTAMRAHHAEPYWLDQCQAIMLCAEADCCWLVWFDTSMQLHELLVAADLDRQADIADRAERFMAAIDLGIVPDWVDLSYENVATLHPHPAGAAELDDDGLDLVRQLDTLRGIKKEAEQEERRTKDAIAKLLLDAESGTWNGIEVVTWRPNRSSLRFDEAMFAADHPDLHEKYLREKPGARPMLTKLEVGR